MLANPAPMNHYFVTTINPNPALSEMDDVKQGS
jgi:hypothetical protein